MVIYNLQEYSNFNNVQNALRREQYDPIARRRAHYATYNPVARRVAYDRTLTQPEPDTNSQGGMHASIEADIVPNPQEAVATQAAPVVDNPNAQQIAATPPVGDNIGAQQLAATQARRKLKIAQSWDWDKACPHCGCQLHLVSATAAQRKKCCQNGKLVYWKSSRNPSSNTVVDDDPMPVLRELSKELTDIICYGVVFGELSKSSNVLNKTFAIARTGVDNGGEGGYDRIAGTHSASIHGRVYTNIPSSMSTRANVLSSLRSFVIDSLPEPNARADGTNGTVDPQDTEQLFNILRRINPFAQVLR